MIDVVAAKAAAIVVVACNRSRGWYKRGHGEVVGEEGIISVDGIE